MKRVLIATLAAIASLWLLGFLASFVADGADIGLASSLGHMDPVNLLVTAIAMCLGGYIEGKRFIGVALGIVCVLWIVIVYVLLQIAKPTEPDALPHILAYNRVQIALSALAACAGAAIGAWLKMKRAARPAGT